jgi:glycosyltransferase involved in cell wall biosynthesis
MSPQKKQATIDILIPTYSRPTALAVTLTSVAAQTFRDFNIIIADQTEKYSVAFFPELKAVVRMLEARGNRVTILRNLPRRGMAQQRQFLLEAGTSPYLLYLDDDVILEPEIVGRLLSALQEENCGFAGSGVIGLSFMNEVRSQEQAIEFWEGPVEPEEVLPGSKKWQRYRLHDAANLWHLQKKLALTPAKQKKYRVAWIGGCVLYDAAKLRDCGGFTFWKNLPPVHCGEDVLAQHMVMKRYGGFGLLPSGVFHQELPTTLPVRAVNAPQVLLAGTAR